MPATQVYSGPKEVVALPSPSKVGSKAPSAVNRAAAKAFPAVPAVTILPSGSRATPVAADPKPEATMPSPSKPVSRLPSAL